MSIKIPGKTAKKIVHKIISQKPTDELSLMRANRRASAQFKLAPLAKRIIAQAYEELVRTGKLKFSPHFNKLLKVRAVRTLSGVAPLTVLTKPYSCPGKCVYCPSEPKMPKSYLSNEPAAMRAVGCDFDPYQQVRQRIKALIANGHQPEKIELLVLGGTWSAYPWKYQQWFIKRCFEAANNFGKKKIASSSTLEKAQKINEKTKYRIIGVTLETRPDLITAQEIKRLRKLGCTRVQLGAQILDDKILKLVKRGHKVEDTVRATKLLKDNCFKIDYHLMPNLPGSTVAKDIKTMEQIFSDERFKPDQIKIYPTVVNEYAPLYKWYQQGKYKPYPHKKLVELMLKLKSLVPCYCRINRLIRDIPEESIVAGNKITNLRQLLEKEMWERGIKCKCIRCREVRNKCRCEAENRSNSAANKIKLFIDKYQASGGIEYFISYESPQRDLLYAFIRLRVPDNDADMIFTELKNAGLIRELHTYGQLQSVGAESQAVQHKGLGKKLMAEAERLTKKHGLQKIAVISGIGVRDYYRKLGYKLEGSYMVKKLK